MKPLPVIPSRRFDRPTDTTDAAGANPLQSYGATPAVRKPEAHEPTSKQGRPSPHKPAAPPPGTAAPPVPGASHHRSSADSHGHQHHRCVGLVPLYDTLLLALYRMTTPSCCIVPHYALCPPIGWHAFLVVLGQQKNCRLREVFRRYSCKACTIKKA